MLKSSMYILQMPNKAVFPFQTIKIRLNENFEYNGRIHNNFIGLVTNIEETDSNAPEKLKSLQKIDKFSEYGTLAKIISQESSTFSYNNSDKQYREIRTYNAIAITRFKVIKFTKKTPYLLADIEILKDEMTSEQENKLKETIEFKELKKLGIKYLENLLRPEIFESRKQSLENEQNPIKFSFSIAGYLEIPALERLELLQINDPTQRVSDLLKIVQRVITEVKLTRELDEKVKKEHQKDSQNYFLKRKLNEINKQLYGEGNDELSEYDKKIQELNLPENVKKVVDREMKRLRSSSQNFSAESNVIRNYVDTILDLPWNQSSKDINDLEKAEQILERDHFGLDKVKKRILEFLAVRNLKGNSKGSIICLHGPPGVGKTSLGKSIAESLGRKFERIALGGVRDEAEIRGHRRTYVGALPGVFIQTFRKCKTNNPVILLDEIDKLTRDIRGDPSSALLEVLDPAQNHTFTDHYLALPFDLSKVLFIATANKIDSIQPALLDRLELINIPGYTVQEKLNIAEKYLVERQVDENGLKKEFINFSKEALEVLIQGYTREAGVRELERVIGSICRNVAVKYNQFSQKKLQTDFPTVYVTPELVLEILGTIIYDEDVRDRINQPGIAIGMAWTAVGGKVLYVEASRSRGKGKIEITGQLGDIMKESVFTGLGWIKANMDKLGINIEKIIPQCELQKGDNSNRNIFDFIDINIHFPAAASPKDGPSAGITIITALVSLLTERKVRSDISMTGEVSLKGLVLPVGGIKEKCIAAYSAGIKTIILPFRNKKDIEEISKDIKEKIDFHFVKDVHTVLQIALEKNIFNPVEEHDDILNNQNINKLSKL